MQRSAAAASNESIEDIYEPQECIDGSGCSSTGILEQDHYWHFGPIWVPNYVTRFCSCSTGEARRAEQNARLAEMALDHALVPARFRNCSFETYPVSPQTRGAVSQIRAWAAEEPGTLPGLFIWGPVGTGKTGCAVSALRASFDRKRWGFLFSVSEFLSELRAEFDRPRNREATGASVEEKARTSGILVLDDLGAERATDWAVEKLHALIAYRHAEELETVITSNLPLDALAERIGERTAWRIAELCQVVKLDGPNLRDRGRRGE